MVPSFFRPRGGRPLDKERVSLGRIAVVAVVSLKVSTAKTIISIPAVTSLWDFGTPFFIESVGICDVFFANLERSSKRYSYVWSTGELLHNAA